MNNNLKVEGNFPYMDVDFLLCISLFVNELQNNSGVL